MKTKNNYLKYVAIGLVIVFLIAAFLLLQEWEKQQGRFPVSGTEEGVVKYEGKEYVLRDDVETFLVLGLDRYKDAHTSESHESGSVQADFLMLFVFDNTSKTTTAIHINRDTMANVHRLDVGGNKVGIVEKKQIALAYNYAYGDGGSVNCRNTADSVSELLKNVRVNQYMSLTMDAVVVANDLVGGVEVTVLDDFTGIDDHLIKGEKVTLMGEQALRYVRTRYGLEDSTNSARMERQKQYVDALFAKAISCMKSDSEFVLNAADKLSPYLEYNSTEYRLKEYAEKFDSYEFLGIREIEGETKNGEEFVEFHPDEASVWEIVIELFYELKTNDKKGN